MIIELAPFCLLCYWFVLVLVVVGLTMLSALICVVVCADLSWVAWLVYWYVVCLGTLVPEGTSEARPVLCWLDLMLVCCGLWKSMMSLLN
jgi:hypothetical protein